MMLRILSVVLFFIATGMCSCSSTKFSTKLNAIDSVIRIANPDHNCGCDNKGKTLELRSTNNGKYDMFYYQTVYVKSREGLNHVMLGKSIKDELVKLIPELKNYRRIYIEFVERKGSIPDVPGNYITLGTTYILKNKCTGYIPVITAKDLIKRSHNKKFETSLCE